MFLGDLPTHALPDKMNKADGETLRGQVCEARFYIAEYEILLGRQADAKQLLQSAVARCPASFVELKLAKAELNRLPQ